MNPAAEPPTQLRRASLYAMYDPIHTVLSIHVCPTFEKPGVGKAGEPANKSRIQARVEARARVGARARDTRVQEYKSTRAEERGNYLREEEAMEVPGERGDSSRGSWLEEGCLAISYV